ncbi:ATP-binding protein [Mucilaginibacter rubeus]|uniref:ATP-binding protein n=1 Tax=Mucilaginibacter rubeus TaxID=2027860 RepID=UPI00166B3B71|nr:ATP-binding protein [Mucilaginibacter rubeus]GGA96131.1 sensor histidine kinase [Mucilaginibacter rubeus]
MSASANSLQLAKFPSLQDVPAEQLLWLAANSMQQDLNDGEILTSPDVPLTGSHFIMAGACIVYNFQQGARRDLGTLTSGEITGYLPFSRGNKTTVYISATGSTIVLTLPMAKIGIMIAEHYELTQALVHVMCNRIRYMTSLQLQNEKMMALGKLSAGITHEINNPASANISDALNLINYLDGLPVSIQNLPISDVNIEIKEILKTVSVIQTRVIEDIAVSFKERLRRENDFNDWLLDNGVEDGDEIAEAYVDLGLNHLLFSDLSRLYQNENLAALLKWLAELFQAQRVARNMLSSSKRIEQLVKAVKTYTHMDRGSAKQRINIHTGIRNALVMLEHKRKQLNVQLVEDYDTGLPEVTALVGELNQVWTNLIDNALDAMEKNHSGTLAIRTERDKEFVRVTVTDNGAGIPEDIQALVFDPFFTTKAMGKGTGIGLEVVKTIITQHSGTVKLQSSPGNTSFIICFPIDN